MVVLGAGRIGTALAARAEKHSVPCTLLDRAASRESLDIGAGSPILVATRNDDLLGVIAGIPAHRTADLVFIQNGALRTFLRENSLASCTRGLLYFAVARKGQPISEGKPSPFSGPHADAVVAWLGALDLAAHKVDWGRFTLYEFEKLTWLSTMGVLCTAHDCTVGEVCTTHERDLEGLVGEMALVGRAAYGVEVPLDFLMTRIKEYSMTIADYRASVKEWAWRNGWLVKQAKRYHVATPLHEHLLRQQGHPV